MSSDFSFCSEFFILRLKRLKPMQRRLYKGGLKEKAKQNEKMSLFGFNENPICFVQIGFLPFSSHL